MFPQMVLSQQPQAKLDMPEAGGTDPAQGRGIVQWLQCRQSVTAVEVAACPDMHQYAMFYVGFCCLGFAICSQDA